MKSIAYVLVLFLIGCKPNSEDSQVKIISAPNAIGTKEDPFLRFDFEMMQTVDPNTGKLPVMIHRKELEFARKLPSKQFFWAKTNSSDWTLTGPSNVGGRTRALALDIMDEEVMIAGGVSGGMWRSTNGGSSWNRASHPAAINSVTCVVQDISPGQTGTWYHGTGELRGNSARLNDTPYRGDGIFKSTDGGQSWDVLASTAFETFSEFESPFNYIWNIQIKPKQTGEGDVYAAIYGGIVRSSDGGESWTTVLGDDLINVDMGNLNDSGAPYYTNVLITPTGDLFATLSTATSLGDSLENTGIFKSNDGVNWENISPAGLSQTHDRIVMSYAPSNDKVLYFFIANNDSNELWVYNNGKWSNRTFGLPADDKEMAPLDTQASFNMVIKVHPEDPDVVYIGGTNLYRSDNGFATLARTSHIGGYDPEKSSNPYTGHHPDMHDISFYPSDPNKMLTACDGGIRVTYDNLASKVSWVSLNNGYVTSQFYTVALSKEEGANEVLGGMQDNGTYIKSLGGEGVPWKRLIGGDGSYCATTPGNLFWYVSFQEGATFRISLDNNKEMTAFAQVDPLKGNNYLFINPFILDPNNYNRMYLAGGDVIWRNDNLSQIPSGDQNPSDINWSKVRDTELNGMSVTAMDISTNPADILYFGSAQGLIFKVDNANLSIAEKEQIFFQNGYVASISIDPTDANHAMFVYGNYNIPSIFMTNDGGSAVYDVGGNLEENIDGSGNGLSIRWCEIIPMLDGTYTYYVGTSSGLYSTKELLENETIWEKEGAETIGSSVIRMMDYRSSDGRIVVATHGNGVFETELGGTLPIAPDTESIETIVLNGGYPNPFDDEITIEMDIPRAGRVKVLVINTSGQRIKNLLDAPQHAGQVVASWDGTSTTGTPVDDGLYFYQVFYEGQTCSGKMLLRK